MCYKVDQENGNLCKFQYTVSKVPGYVGCTCLWLSYSFSSPGWLFSLNKWFPLETILLKIAFTVLGGSKIIACDLTETFHSSRCLSPEEGNTHWSALWTYSDQEGRWGITHGAEVLRISLILPFLIVILVFELGCWADTDVLQSTEFWVICTIKHYQPHQKAEEFLIGGIPNVLWPRIPQMCTFLLLRAVSWCHL